MGTIKNPGGNESRPGRCNLMVSYFGKKSIVICGFVSVYDFVIPKCLGDVAFVD